MDAERLFLLSNKETVGGGKLLVFSRAIPRSHGSTATLYGTAVKLPATFRLGFNLSRSKWLGQAFRPSSSRNSRSPKSLPNERRKVATNLSRKTIRPTQVAAKVVYNPPKSSLELLLAFVPPPLAFLEQFPWFIYVVLMAVTLALAIVIASLARTAITLHDTGGKEMGTQPQSVPS